MGHIRVYNIGCKSIVDCCRSGVEPQCGSRDQAQLRQETGTSNGVTLLHSGADTPAHAGLSWQRAHARLS